MTILKLCMKYEMYLSFVAIIVGTIAFYGLEDDNKRFFDKVYYVNDYVARITTKGVSEIYFPIGLMVPEMAAIAVVSIIGILISLLIHWYIEAEVRVKKNA